MRKLLRVPLVVPTAPVAVTGVETYTTPFIPIESFDSFGMQIAFTGSPVATVTLEFSFDPVPYNPGQAPYDTPLQPVVFDTIPGTSVATASVSNGVISYDVLHSSASWVRVKWVNASGTGSITSIQSTYKGAQV